MDLDILVLDVLESDDHVVPKKWAEWCRTFRDIVSNSVQDIHSAKQAENPRAKEILKLKDDFDKLKSGIEDLETEEKLLDKKIFILQKEIEDLEKDSKQVKEEKDVLSVQILKLEHEIQERKRKKIAQWNAVKRAMSIYKQNLDIHISLQEDTDDNHIRFDFFIHNEATKDKYFVKLVHNVQKDEWMVKQVEPKLKKEHLQEICGITKSSMESFRISNITLFLCQVRNLFLQHYIETS